MQIHQIGPDDIGEYSVGELDQTLYAWLVHDYTIGDWCGSGRAAALRISDGMIVFGSLGHCSCYGPLEGFDGSAAFTPEDFLAETTDNIFDDVPSDVMKAKVRELLAGVPA